MNDNEDIPVLEDLVRSGVDNGSLQANQAPEAESMATDSANELKELVLDEEIRRILRQHMDAAYAEIMQLIQLQKKTGDKEPAD